MSYTLDIWEPPPGAAPPPDLAAVAALVERLRESNPGPNPRLVELLARLTRRFPDITSRAAAELPEWELAWSDGPLSADGPEAVYVLGVRHERLDEVRPVVISEANALGLAVFDTQAAEAWLPGGRTFGARARPAGTGERERAPRGRDVAPAVFDALTGVLETAGFRPARSSFRWKRKLASGWQEVKIMIEDHWPTATEFCVYAGMRFEPVVDLAAQLVAPRLKLPENRSLASFLVRQQEWLRTSSPLLEPRRRDYRVTTVAQLEEAVAEITEQVRLVLLPILDGTRTIEGLDRWLNTDPLSASVFFHGYDGTDWNLLVAHLARNPRLESIAAEAVPRILANDYRDQALICLEYARSHPAD